MCEEYSGTAKIKEECSSGSAPAVLAPLSPCCQCCAETTNLTHMSQTFTHQDNQETYTDILYFCYAIKLENSTPMMCEKCIAKLTDSYTFKLQVESTQQKLKYIASNPSLHYADGTEDKFFIEIKTEEDMDYQLDSLFEDNSNESVENNKTKSKRILNYKTFKDEFRNTKKLQGSLQQKKRKKHKKLDRKKVVEVLNHFQCNTCKECFESKRVLKKHMKNHNQLFICHVCGKESNTKKSLLSHVVSHNSERIQCDVCNKFLKKGSMLRHLRKHTGDLYCYPCKLCDEKFPSYNNRLYHLAVAHGIDEKKYTCKVCTKAFRFSGGLSTHVKRCHLQEKKRACSECDKLFFSNNELVKHMLKHTKVRSFQCDICLKSYGRKSTLQSHKKIHNNIKAHKCPVCFREFTQKCTLKCHMKVHEKMNAALQTIATSEIH